ncbi:MAG: peptidase C39 family protein, partial [Actinomycetota bacterium]|nr:peptidase C39 family protein [Actinomycetota bacterium]
VCERAGGTGEVRLISAPKASRTVTGAGCYRGSLTSPVHETSTQFDTLLPSWNVNTPVGTWLGLEVRVRSGDVWTDWFDMGIWASGTESVERHSVKDQESGSWRVPTDTVESIGPVFADAYRYRLTLFTKDWGVSPEVRGVFLTASDSRRHGEDLGVPADVGSRGRELEAPVHSQMVYPDGGEAWCSPVSLSMMMAYWAGKTGEGKLNQPVPTVVQGTYDAVYEGTGNWPFNTAYASSFGLVASVNRFSSLGQVERWVASGVPVIASIKWDNRDSEQQLTGAPLPSSDGHLLVVRGFDSLGNVVVNDPAGGDDSRVRRVYRRDEFSRAWFSGSGGVVYLVYPEGWSIPDRTYARGSW